MITEVLIMPFPAIWAIALVNDEPIDLDDAAWGKCRILIEQLRDDGYVVVAVADNAWPRVTDQFRLCGGNANSGEVLDYVVFDVSQSHLGASRCATFPLRVPPHKGA